MEKTCIQCNKIVTKPKNRSVQDWEARFRFCSKRCRIEATKILVPWNKGTIGVMLANKTSFKKGLTPHNKGKKTNKPAWNSGLVGFCVMKKREESPHWRGGKQGEHKLIRNSVEYKFWRTAVFQRDGYSCQECKTRGGELNADHIKPFVWFPELRFAIDNGRTLCVACHRQTPTYGGRVKNFKRATGTLV